MTRYSAQVSIVKTIQVRTTIDGTSWNKRYRVPSVAASEYASYRMMERRRVKWEEDKHGAAYHRQTQADVEYEERLAERYVRFLTRAFKRLLES